MHINIISFHTGTWPDALKMAKIKLIFKEGDRTKPDNQRSIYIFPTFTRVIEKHPLRRLESHCEKNSITSDNQYGFIKGRSTEPAILKMTEKIKGNIEDKILTPRILVDLTKDFDLINHYILQDKLPSNETRGVPIKLNERYLRNRKQFVNVNDTSSRMSYVIFGVPQGSILGLFLFLLFINDIPDYLHINTFLCGDDTNILLKLRMSRTCTLA